MNHFIFLPYLLSASWNAVLSSIFIWVSNSFSSLMTFQEGYFFVGSSNWCSLSDITMLYLVRWGEWWLSHNYILLLLASVVWLQSGYTISTQVSGVSQTVHWACSMVYDYIISISYSPQGYPGSISTFLIVIQSTFTFDIVERTKQALAYFSDNNNLCLIIPRQLLYQCAAILINWHPACQLINSCFIQFKGNFSPSYLTRTKQ